MFVVTVDRKLGLGLALALVVFWSVVATPIGALASTTVNGNEIGQNRTTIHEHPNEAAGDGDLDGTVVWLTHELTRLLDESIAHLDEEEYDLARRVVGDQYDNRFNQYVELGVETGREPDDDLTDAFEEAGMNQRDLIESLEAYNETRVTYQQARERGDDEQALRHARELDELASTVNETATSLNQNYQTIEGNSTADPNESSEAVDSINRNVAATQEEIRSVEFVGTELEVSVVNTTTSILEPLEVTGAVRIETGALIANAQVEVLVDDRVTRTTTDESGSFTVVHRPTTESLDSEATVRYVPTRGSIYRESESSIDVTIEQVNATISLVDVTQAVRFDDEFVVRGSVTAGGERPAEVPVVITLGGND